MSAFSGPQRPGAMRDLRELKRLEAQDRQANVEHDRTRAHREGRCNTGDHLLRAIYGESGGAA